MSRLRKKAELIMKYGDSVIAEKQRKTAIIKRTAYSVSGICAAVGIGFSIWNNDAIKNSADFDKYNSSSVVGNSTEPTESGTFTISSECTAETTTSTAADITVNSAETSAATTAEIPHTQRVTVSDITTKKTLSATSTTAVYTENIVTITETQLAETVTVTNIQTTAKDEPTTMTTANKPTTATIASKDEPTKMTTASKDKPTTGTITTKSTPTTATTASKYEPTTTGSAISPTLPESVVTKQTIITNTRVTTGSIVRVPNNTITSFDEMNEITKPTSYSTQTSIPFTSASTPTTTTTGRNPTTIPDLDIITNGKGEVVGISYDGVDFYRNYEIVDKIYVDERDKREYLGDINHKHLNDCYVFYVYDYKEQGKPALILCSHRSGDLKLFVAE